MGTPFLVEQYSPNVLASTTRESPNVEMGEQESRKAYLMGTPYVVEQGSPNVLSSTMRDSPNVLMGERECR
jgi:hypothetical protein